MNEPLTDYLGACHTLTGMPIGDALKRMKEVLPPRAYKAVPGAVGLTDINPAYLTDVATQVFGICGIGWSINYKGNDMSLVARETTTRNGNARTVFSANLLHMELQFAYVDPNGEVKMSAPIPASGGSENDTESYATRGALTNAIGAAFAKLCWQLPVYQGKVDHNNAAELYAKQQERKKATLASTVSTPAPAPEPDPIPEPETVTEPVYVDVMTQEPPFQPTDEAQPTPAIVSMQKPETEPAPKPAAVKFPSMPEKEEDQVFWAENLVIPAGIGVPLAGSELGMAQNDAAYGSAILKFLSGKSPNAKGKVFTPSTPDQEALMKAADLLLTRRDSKKKATK
jgi:outer membrane biosynthesis protein TonB